jgi:biotin synthase-like enzyme
MDNELIENAQKVFEQNFPLETCFERAVFFSWYCGIADCKYCYMSTQPKDVIEKRKLARRSTESILAEFMICKKLGWDIGFFSGGNKAFSYDEFKELLRLITIVTEEKIWVNIGPLGKKEIEDFLPYIKGVVGSVETINQEIHEKVCPSKPIAPIEKMFKETDSLGLDKAITIILGLGETLDDFPSLIDFITKHSISKIHFYGLNPHKGTMFEDASPPPAEYQAEWIAKTRNRFPKIDIQCGIWADRVDRVELLLKAGANSISKFPAIRRFGSDESVMIEKSAEKAGRKFIGSLTELPVIDPSEEVSNLPIDSDLKEKIVHKMQSYLKSMKKSSKSQKTHKKKLN